MAEPPEGDPRPQEKLVPLVPFGPPAPNEGAAGRYIHSDIYERLVTDEDDLIGLVAYGLYQAEKRRWINQWKGTRGEIPPLDEVKSFCFIYDEARLTKLQSESEELIFKATEERIKQQRSEMVAWAFNARIVQEFGALRAEIGKTSGYRHHIFAHLLSFAILVGVYSFITFAAAHEPTIVGFLQDFGKSSPSAHQDGLPITHP